MNVETSSFKVSLIRVGFQRNLNFLNTFSKQPQISSFIKIRPVGAELFHAETDGRAGMTKQIVAFRTFANAPKKDHLDIVPLLPGSDPLSASSSSLLHITQGY